MCYRYAHVFFSEIFLPFLQLNGEEEDGSDVESAPARDDRHSEGQNLNNSERDLDEGGRASKRRSDEGLGLKDELDFEAERESGEEDGEEGEEGMYTFHTVLYWFLCFHLFHVFSSQKGQ